jgi:CheY-like chemotaxis protein
VKPDSAGGAAAAHDPSLVTALEIVRECGGYQEIVPAPDRGRTVSIYFPRVAATTEADDTVVALAPELETLVLPPDEVRSAAKAPDSPAAADVILLVEDDEAVRTLVRHVLQRAGYTVLDAGAGKEALEIGDGHPSPVHLLITDVVMPGMSGPELARRLQLRHPNLRTLLITGYARKPASGTGVVSGSDEVLPKPFTAATLLQKVRQLLEPAAPELENVRDTQAAPDGHPAVNS